MDETLREDPYPFQAHLGFEIADWREGYARVAQPVAPHLANRHGALHGGVHATLLDTAMGYAGCWTGDPERRQLALTLSLTVNYQGRSSGRRLTAEARQTGGGRRIFYAAGEVRDEDGVLLASATGVFRYLDG